MTRYGFGAAALCCLLSMPFSLFAQTFDFENTVSGWTQTGDAFRDQPYCGAITSSIFAPAGVGGSYWKDLPFPLGQQGTCLITTIVKQSGASTGTLTSPEFSLDPNAPFFSFRIGGTEDMENERVELQVRIPEPADDTLIQQVRDWSIDRTGLDRRDGPYRIVYAATGHNSETLRQEVVEIPKFLLGLPARLRILDNGSSHHINADLLRFTSTAPPVLRVPVWGLADYHTHPMTYMAFGGMKGIPTLWGNPGGDYEDYFDPIAILRDIPKCVRGHGGGWLAEPFIHSSQMMHYSLFSIASSFVFTHGRHGAPEYDNFPSHTMGAHEQMHITMIRRAYEGGLRLMVALATDNKAAQFLTGRVEHGHMVLIGEKESMEAQLRGMKSLAELNRNWMEIAYSSADARRIILHGKLAVVLGVEFDQLGDMGLGSEEREPELEAEYLWSLGARAVIPIHGADNRLGGPAVFIGPYNWLNDLLHRSNTDASIGDVKKTTPAYFQVMGDDSCAASPQTRVGRCVQYRLDPKLQLRVGIGRSFFHWFWLRQGPGFFVTSPQKQFKTQYGNKNTLGLTSFGKRYIDTLMDRGMIIDTAHMSDRSVADTFAQIGKRLAKQHPGCDDFAMGSPARPECDADAYPTIISHAHFRGQAIYDGKQADYLPSEYDISDSNLEMLRRTGGVVGPFVTEPRVSESNIAGIVNDCGNSSKDFGFSFRYAANRVNTQTDDDTFASRVGFATDMTLIPMVSPRFGEHACEGYKRQPQQLRVAYSGSRALKPYKLGPRAFDFNEDGLAHYGLLPDLFQDLKNLGDNDARLLFRSAEGYLRLWEKSERLSGRAGS